MVRTGDESHLSAPITFEQIKAQTLPLRRDDWILEGIEVVRVSLTTAVNLIANLQQKEEAAFPSKKNGHVIDRSLCPADWRGDYADLAVSADVWAENICKELMNLDSRMLCLPEMLFAELWPLEEEMSLRNLRQFTSTGDGSSGTTTNT